jgi:phenylacetyl-CoA:acceptor oxidoreductase subunit 1
MHGVVERPSPRPAQAPRWGMVVDLNRCVGCQTCTAACKHANDTPPGVQWRRVLDVERGTFPDVERLFLVVGCQHCDEPPCVPVCPTGATHRREDGLVTQDYDLCIGCASCVVACPYQARTIVKEPRSYFGGAPTRQEAATAHPERIGVAQKCTFCVGRLDRGLREGLRPGIDPAATPACAASCIAQAIQFGDFNDPDSNVSRLIRENPSFVLHAELGTKPSIRYLYETPSVPGRAPAPDDAAEPPGEDATAGPLQRFWDWRAAMNFIFGGFGSGLAVITALAATLGSLPDSLLRVLLLASGISIAIGLVAVFFKIGRKRRLLHALRRPQSSWMTREIYVVGAYYALLAAALWQPVALHLDLVAVAAFAFLYCQARILAAAKGIPAWRHPLIAPMMIASGVAEGAGLAAIAASFAAHASAERLLLAAIGVALAVVNAGLWHRYRSGADAGGLPPAARRALAAATPAVHGIGHAAPGLLYLAALAMPAEYGAPLLALAGLLAAAGGAIWKTAVILFAAYQQGFALPMLPGRGSGARAAPARLRVAAE